MTLAEFLLARIAEDRRHVEFVRDFIPEHGGQGEYINPARVLAECEAKRRIVEYAGLIADDPTLPSTHLARHVLADLASIYADHPDYREEWKP